MDKVSIIKDGREVLGFRINDREFYVEEDGCAEVEKRDLRGFDVGSIPQDFSLRPLEGSVIVFEGEISSDSKHHGIAYMNIETYRKYWDYKYGAGQYYGAMKQALAIRKRTSHDVNFIELEDDGAWIHFRYEIRLKQNMPIDKALICFKDVVDELEAHTERLLEKVEISSAVLSREDTFTKQVLLPLVRAMGMDDVHYNHGKREFGKDITFSETDRFGVRRNYGVQVKAGNLSGKARSVLDQTIGQIDDAFATPYVEVSSREQRYISTLVIAISGRFTDNAKDKIMAKVGRRTVYFLDIEKVEELLAKYMNRHIRK